MINDPIFLEFVFSRSIVPSGDEQTIARFIRTVKEICPEWASGFTVWDPSPRGRKIFEGNPDIAAKAVLSKATWADGRRVSGNVELRGSTPELALICNISDRPLGRVGGRLLMANTIKLEARRRLIGGKDSYSLLLDFLRDGALSASPVWAAIYSGDEYRHRVMQATPSLAAAGRDFSKYLPGVFPANFYGSAYVDLMGRADLSLVPAVVSEAGSGVLVKLSYHPADWDSPENVVENDEVTSRIGKRYFYPHNGPPAEGYAAPEWETRQP
jgi:hypothetical protein